MRNTQDNGIGALRNRVLKTLGPAAAGALAGFYYGRWFGDPELVKSIGLPGLYATMGAILGILVVRLGTIMWMIVRDFADRDDQ